MPARRLSIPETAAVSARHCITALLTLLLSQLGKLPAQLVDILNRQQFKILRHAVRLLARPTGGAVGLDLLEDVIANLERNPAPAAYSGAARRFSFSLALCALPVAGVSPALFV
ncbi:hypothetical protein [Serratia rubidaea]|uniref:hypothetical protein n=1 Tax=Serratia rubidaea TaxID=61652 RepID=UPI003FA3B5CD